MGADCLLSFLALSHQKKLRIFACKNRKLLTQKKESEQFCTPVPAGDRQIFFRFMILFICLDRNMHSVHAYAYNAYSQYNPAVQ